MVNLGHAYSPNWGTGLEDKKKEGWIRTEDGGPDSWTPVRDPEERVWQRPTSAGENWVKKTRNKNEWTHG